MFFKEKSSPAWLSWLVTQVVMVVTSHVKVSYIWGSLGAHFSPAGLCTPLLGSFGGGVSLVLAGSFVRGLFCGHFIGIHSLAYHIPGLFAALAWAYPSTLFHIVLPVTCMALFWLHPVGLAAAPYALFWLIPVALYGKKSSSLIKTAISVSFIAHAVGSVIWLYTVPMLPQAWLSLMPVVVIERLMHVCMLVVGYYGIQFVSKSLYAGYNAGLHWLSGKSSHPVA